MTDNDRPENQNHDAVRLRGRRAARWGIACIAALAVLAGSLTTHTEPASAATTPVVTRIGGADRVGSAIAVSQAAFPSGAPIVYVGSSAQFGDNIAAGPVAARAGGPLLFSASTVSAATLTEIRRLGARKIVVVGDAASVPESAVTQLRAVTGDVTRIGGGEKYASARAIAESGFPAATTAFIVSGRSWAGALAASAAAAQSGAPVIPVYGTATTLDAATAAQLKRLGVQRAVLVGNTATVSSGIESAIRALVPRVDRAGGADTYAVSVSVNSLFFSTSPRAYLVSGMDYSDSLGVASLATVARGPVYEVQAGCVPDAVKTDITGRLAATAVTLVGSTRTLSSGVAGLVACSTVNAQTKAASEKALVTKLNAAIPGLPGGYNVSAFEAGGLKRAVSVRGSDAVEPASSIKLFAAYAAMKRIDQGRLYYSTRLSSGYTLAQCLRAMIHISDNYCHSDIINLIGANTMNAMFAAEGYSGTHYAGTWKGRYYSYKTSTTNDLTTLVLRLNSGSLLSAASSAYMLKLMKEQIWRSRIGSSVPPGVGIATKPGELWVSSGMTQIDAGLVYAPGGTYSVVIMGYRGATKAGVAALARIVYEHFNGKISRVATFPVENQKVIRATVARSSAGGRAIFSIGAGATVEAVDSVRLWYRVISAGRTGYVSSLDLGNRY